MKDWPYPRIVAHRGGHMLHTAFAKVGGQGESVGARTDNRDVN